MKFLKTYKVFESIDDFYNKLSKAKEDYNNRVSEIKNEYVKDVKHYILELTDDYSYELYDTVVKGSSIISEFRFDVPKNKVDDFFSSLESVDDIIKSVSDGLKTIKVKEIYFVRSKSPNYGPIGGKLEMPDNIRLSSIKEAVKKKLESLDCVIINGSKINIEYLTIILKI